MNFYKKGTEKIELVAKPDVHVRNSPPKSLLKVTRGKLQATPNAREI